MFSSSILPIKGNSKFSKINTDLNIKLNKNKWQKFHLHVYTQNRTFGPNGRKLREYIQRIIIALATIFFLLSTATKLFQLLGVKISRIKVEQLLVILFCYSLSFNMLLNVCYHNMDSLAPLTNLKNYKLIAEPFLFLNNVYD